MVGLLENSTRTYNNVVFIGDRMKKRVTVFGTCGDEGEPKLAVTIRLNVYSNKLIVITYLFIFQLTKEAIY